MSRTGYNTNPRANMNHSTVPKQPNIPARINRIIKMQDTIDRESELLKIQFYLQMMQKKLLYPMICSFAYRKGIKEEHWSDYAITFLQRIQDNIWFYCCESCQRLYSVGHSNSSCSNCKSLIAIIQRTIDIRNHLAHVTDASKLATQDFNAIIEDWKRLAIEVLKRNQYEVELMFEEAKDLLFLQSRSGNERELAKQIYKLFFLDRAFYGNIMQKFVFRYKFMPFVSDHLEQNPGIVAEEYPEYPDDEIEMILRMKATDSEWHLIKNHRNHLEYQTPMSQTQIRRIFSKMVDFIEEISGFQQAQEFRRRNYWFIETVDRA
jgi:hypothetical protein